MPANSRWDLIQRYRVKIVKNPGNGRLNNLNDSPPVLNVLNLGVPRIAMKSNYDTKHLVAFKQGSFHL